MSINSGIENKLVYSYNKIITKTEMQVIIFTYNMEEFHKQILSNRGQKQSHTPCMYSYTFWTQAYMTQYLMAGELLVLGRKEG